MKNKQFIILAVVCVVTLLPFMGLTDFHTKGEPREAIVAYSMIETGNWTLPVNNGGDIAYKPPLFHWCIAALSSIAGKVTEYTSRMPSALALIAMVLGGFLFYAKRRGASVALLMGLITLSNFEVHRAGMNCRVDMMLTAFIVLALYQLYRWCEKGQKGFPWIATLFMGCATLTKYPPALHGHRGLSADPGYQFLQSLFLDGAGSHYVLYPARPLVHRCLPTGRR